MQAATRLDSDLQSSASIRVIDPPLAALPSLRQPLNDGERRVLEWFIEILPAGWEIYIQPHLNGLRPDFVLLHPQRGIAVYEVKDWNLQGLDYFIDYESDVPRLMGHRDGKTFSLSRQDPVAAIDLYKREIHGLYVPSLPAKDGFGSIIAGVIFTSATTRDAEDLLLPLREAKGHTKYSRLYPVIGAELLGRHDDGALRALLSSARRIDDRMNDRVAADLRHWLVEPGFSRDQRIPLAQLLTPKQRALCINKERVQFRRIKGPAGSGKSLVLAGRAAELAKQGLRVLVVTFNVTLVNYLLDLAVQYAQSGEVRRQITALNFHYWCRRVAEIAGKEHEFRALWSEGSDHDAEETLRTVLPSKAAQWAAALNEDDRWDAVLVDEGQDFLPTWWEAMCAALPADGSGEALLVADRQQNIYGIKPWTDLEMKGAGFRGPWGELDRSHRMSPSLCRLAADFVDRFQPDVDEHRPIPAQGELEFRTELRWRQLDPMQSVAAECVDAMLGILSASDDDPVAAAELVCIVDREDIGLEVVGLLLDKNIRVLHTFGIGQTKEEKDKDRRRRKTAFFKGDSRVKVTTIQSFKGWESRALVVQITDAADPTALAVAYAAITRLKQDDRGCFLTVVSSAPQLREFGQTWS
ncbi:AAA family ATPase [Inhella gelatinilytica]|uniref:NERD domain-containing protein n=1 Tax=Inhella gelatinilytica TaxID=2795030 RepID=A0A931IXG2_9BURK|nr:AAA family ATPase [Inhella gelatinilytica]MBH9553959.1 NERD domain-containing protein [Inhella gelatinilytica]